MTGSPRVIAAAAVGALVLAFVPPAHAQQASGTAPAFASLVSGSIGGVVLDETGAPVPGAMVSALGPRTAVAVADRVGRFEFRALSPGPYLVRAHSSGFVGSRGQIIDVRASARAASSIALRHAAPRTVIQSDDAAAPPEARPVLAAGIGGPIDVPTGAAAPPVSPTSGVSPAPADPADPIEDDHSETAWRLRHARRGILKDITVPDDLLASDGPGGVGGTDAFGPLDGRGSPAARLATSLFAGMPFTGQFNLLTSSSFDTPQELFSADNFSHGIAYVSLEAPVGEHADWSMRGALTQGDLSSWFLATAYETRAPARHRYDLGLSYSTQRYDGGNPLALREVTDGSRNVGDVYGFDTFAPTSALALTYGARVSRYDYLAGSGLISPHVELTVTPVDHFRLTALASSRALAPGAEEFLPPSDTGLWLPPQRTFSSVVEGQPLQSERTEHLSLEAERDFGTSTISVRAFRQHVANQLVTMFGLDVPSAPSAQVGHYFVGSDGAVDANGITAMFRTALLSRVHGSIAYSLTSGRWAGTGDTAYMVLVAPSAVRPRLDRVQDLSTSIETNVPETSTRVLVVARLSSARPAGRADRLSFDSRFDVQVHQSLPFMDFSSARWEMLIAVKNTFHDIAPDSSVYDELLVVRPPKRIVGGLTLRF
jgi:hypothetical protein